MKFRIFVNNAIEGPYEVEEVRERAGFTLETTVCLDGESDWIPAHQFPVFTRPIRTLPSGDYSPILIETPSELVERQARNWRDAVIEGDIPVSYPPEAVSRSKPISQPAVPKVETAKADAVANRQHSPDQKRKGIFLGVLSFIVIGVYFPQTESIATIYSGFKPAGHSLETMGLRFRSGGGIAHRGKAGRQPSSVKPIQLGLTPQMDEIASEDLGTGYLLKTVVITRIREGTKTQETKTMRVPKHRGRKHVGPHVFGPAAPLES